MVFLKFETGPGVERDVGRLRSEVRYASRQSHTVASEAWMNLILRVYDRHRAKKDAIFHFPIMCIELFSSS
jgi:hypothetical protein